MLRFIRSLIAGVLLGFAKGGNFPDASQTVQSPLEPITTPLRRRYAGEVTIAGGPGSQNIYETFERLPDYVKEDMIAARGRGGYNSANAYRLLDRNKAVVVKHDRAHVVPIANDALVFKKFAEIYALQGDRVVRIAEPDAPRVNPTGGTDSRVEEIANDRSRRGE